MNFKSIIDKARFTVLLGKNGAGKSTLLRTMIDAPEYIVKYISPERGGALKYDPHVDNNMASNEGWLKNTRRVNRFEQFRQQSAVQFRSLEMLILREIEQDQRKRADAAYTFDVVLEKINELLPAIRLIRSDKGFSIASKSGSPISEESISSGESELIALAIEVLVFSRSIGSKKLLLLDEPDVHLHPDLQQKFTRFVEALAIEHDIRVVIATHSTAIIGAFAATADLHIVPVSTKDQATFSEFTRSEVSEQILPVFGAHPLSTTFNKSPVLLLEGEDDRRVFDQIVRSSNGRYAFSPCVVGTVNAMGEWEEWLDRFLPVLYDSPQAFSVRDLDDSNQTHIDDLGCVCRIRLNCYAIENLLLTKQCLNFHGFPDDKAFVSELQQYIESYPAHKFREDVQQLVNQFGERRRLKIKNIRNIIVALLGSSKPWEVVVGQTVASVVSTVDTDPNSVQTYLGEKAVKSLFS